jgi:hypothetical protein
MIIEIALGVVLGILLLWALVSGFIAIASWRDGIIIVITGLVIMTVAIVVIAIEFPKYGVAGAVVAVICFIASFAKEKVEQPPPEQVPYGKRAKRLAKKIEEVHGQPSDQS